MMTSPDLNDRGGAGYGTGVDSMTHGGSTGSSTGSNTGRTDDVSFARSIGADQTSDAANTTDKVKDMAQRGVDGAEDALSQLQAKASELTANLIERVNVDELTQKLEEQVRNHPTRTLLMAAGAGFLIGRAAKK
jgi:ElaB/YqjD/DUF883 family membrane-anchored ribosome-binding protein